MGVESFYEKETYDYHIVKGDTVNLKFEFFDENGDDLAVVGWGCTFSVKNPATNTVMSDLTKTHNDGVSGGNGIYFNGDDEIPASLTIEKTNQIIVVLSFNDTSEFEEGVYPFDVEFLKDDNITRVTPIVGNLIVSREITASV